MKITLNTKEIIEIIKTSSKTNVKQYSIAGEFCFEINNNLLTIYNTDMDITIKHIITIDSTAQNTTFVINTKNFLDIVKNIQSKNFDIKINEDSIEVGGCFLKIIKENEINENSNRQKKDFWNLHEHLLKFRYCNGTTPQFIANIEANEFIDNLKDIINYVGKDEQINLHGVGIQFIDSKLNIVATNSKYLKNIVFNKIIINSSATYNNEVFILPKHFCQQLIACKNILKNDTITLNLYGNHIFIDHHKLNLTSKLIDSNYPPYKSIFTNPNSYLKLNVKNFLNIVKMASAVKINCKYNKINLQINETKLIITKQEKENILFNMPINILEHNINNNFLMSFNNNFLLQIIESYKNFIDNDEINITFNNKYFENQGSGEYLTNPIFITSTNNNKNLNLFLTPIVWL